MLRRKRLADLPEHWDFGELTPGAQVRVRRSGYYHHGIYIGNGEIVHFDGSPNEQDAAAVRVRRTGIAVVVNNDNTVDNLSLEQVRQIFTGEVTDWSAVK